MNSYYKHSRTKIKTTLTKFSISTFFIEGSPFVSCRLLIRLAPAVAWRCAAVQEGSSPSPPTAAWRTPDLSLCSLPTIVAFVSYRCHANPIEKRSCWQPGAQTAEMWLRCFPRTIKRATHFRAHDNKQSRLKLQLCAHKSLFYAHIRSPLVSRLLEGMWLLCVTLSEFGYCVAY